MTQGVASFRTSTHIMCTGCGELKELSQFFISSASASGRRPQCKRCDTARVEKYRKEHRETHLETVNNRRARNRDREKVKSSAYWKANAEQRREIQRAYEKENPEKIRAHQKVRQALKKGLLVRPETCSNCGALERIQSHHENYEFPLEVTWLCQPCHKRLHRSQRKEG